MAIWDFSSESPLGVLRNEALRFDEYATKAFWHYFLINYIFTGPGWNVATEQPPVSYSSQRRVDIVVKRFDQRQFRILLFLEAKKSNVTPQDIVQVESQGYTACYEFLMNNPDIEAVWAMTVFGPQARFWVCRINGIGVLEPLFPFDHGIGEKGLYLDIKTHQSDFQKTFEYMISNPLPDAALLSTSLVHDTGVGSSTEQAPISEVDFQTSTQVVFEKIKSDYIKCRMVISGESVQLGTQWEISNIRWIDGSQQGYSRTDQGRTYWTWTLEEEKKEKGKGKKR
ncbi:hypothetical protein AUP68_02521 [Ilyonectria robusta]